MKGLALLLSKGAPKGEPDEKEMPGEGDGPAEEEKESSMEEEFLSDAFDAVKSGDKDAFYEAMKNFKSC